MSSQTIDAWHFVDDHLKDGSPVPPDGVTLIHDGELKLCESGLHASVRIIDALKYAPGDICCRVMLGGTIIADTDKFVASERTIIWKVNAADSLRAFARLCALDVEHLWDMPPVVREFLTSGDESLRFSARSAAKAAAEDAVRAAARATTSPAVCVAEDAAWAAARATSGAAARAARGAAEDAARASRGAAWDAARAAWAAARATTWDAAGAAELAANAAGRGPKAVLPLRRHLHAREGRCTAEDSQNAMLEIMINAAHLSEVSLTVPTSAGEI